MALAGLFLALFLVVHLCINLLMLCNDGGVLFAEAVHFMSSSMFIKIFEVFLFGAFIIHILYGILLQIQNWRSRPTRYKVVNKTKTPFLSKYMIYTGAVIAIFLAIHFMNFYFVKHGFVQPPAGLGKEDFYAMAILLFQNPAYSTIYIVLIILMGFHLNHAIKSAFQTLGLNHDKYNSTIHVISAVYSITIAIGFCIIPIYFLFFFNN